MAQDEKMLVPVEPTDAMVEAAYEHWLNKTGDAGRYVVRNIIKAALSAATVQPAAVAVEKALEPFAAMASVGGQRPKDDALWAGQDGRRITYGDFRRAAEDRATLSQPGPASEGDP